MLDEADDVWKTRESKADSVRGDGEVDWVEKAGDADSRDLEWVVVVDVGVGLGHLR